MKDINSYFAEKCGIELYKSSEINEQGCCWYERQSPNIDYYFEWSIQNPCCREICREKFRIVTNCDEVTGLSNDKYEWEAEACVQHSDHISCKTGYGQTISEAEIDLLTRIYEAEKEL